MGFNLRVVVTPPTANVKVEIRSLTDVLVYTEYTDPEGILLIGLSSTAYPFVCKAVLPDYGLESGFIDCYDGESYAVTFDLSPEPLKEESSWKPLAGIGVVAGAFFKKVFIDKK